MQNVDPPTGPEDLPDEQATESRALPGTALKEGEDYYYEGPYMVFTEQYLLKRGTCCHSGCRHCPYKESSESRSSS